MRKKHFIALADTIKATPNAFDQAALDRLADFCHEQNPRFNRSRWLRYIAGECGPCGGEIRRR